MPALLDTIDPDGLLEYSVVFTDRSLNHMSFKFKCSRSTECSMLATCKVFINVCAVLPVALKLL